MIVTCMIFGDFNSRLGTSVDYIEGIYKVPRRVVIGDDENKLGESLKQCLLEMRLADVNGRVMPEHDNFTPASTNGNDRH